jgi:hypothetical protein
VARLSRLEVEPGAGDGEVLVARVVERAQEGAEAAEDDRLAFSFRGVCGYGSTFDYAG